MGMFDSHTARTWRVRGHGIRVAEKLAQALRKHFVEEKCDTSTLECVTVVKEVVTAASRLEALSALRVSSSDHTFLEAFAHVAEQIVNGWTWKLDRQGDVVAYAAGFASLRHKFYRSAHWIAFLKGNRIHPG